VVLNFPVPPLMKKAKLLHIMLNFVSMLRAHAAKVNLHRLQWKEVAFERSPPRPSAPPQVRVTVVMLMVMVMRCQTACMRCLLSRLRRMLPQ
jgi:hypothetical protein